LGRSDEILPLLPPLLTKSGVDIHEIKAAFVLLKQCGGIESAKKALDAAREIQKVL